MKSEKFVMIMKKTRIKFSKKLTNQEKNLLFRYDKALIENISKVERIETEEEKRLSRAIKIVRAFKLNNPLRRL